MMGSMIVLRTRCEPTTPLLALLAPCPLLLLLANTHTQRSKQNNANNAY
jgi:hypothetical protein